MLAAGKGTRMRSQTPKVLHPVCGRPLIHYVLDVARAVRSKKIYVALGHQLAQVRDRLPQDIQVYEQKELLGTADAVRQAEGLLAGYRGDVLGFMRRHPAFDCLHGARAFARPSSRGRGRDHLDRRGGRRDGLRSHHS